MLTFIEMSERMSMTQSDQIRYANACGGDVFLGGQPRSITRGGPQRPQFLGPLRTPIRFDPDRPNSAWQDTM